MTLPIILSLFFLYVSIVLYSLFGGADFGMGVIESLLKKRLPHISLLTKKVIGPVWEANHVWLIIVIVILFIAFPKAFSLVCIYLHVPLFLVLIGIVIRGSAFSFRHYDPFKDKSHLIHDKLFRLSSFITPFFFGNALASLTYTFVSTGSYTTQYLAPFLTPGSILSGLFFICLSTYSAWVLLLSDNESTPIRPLLKKMGPSLTALLLSLGAVTFLHLFGPQMTLHALPIALSLIATTIAVAIPLYSQSYWALRLSIGSIHCIIIGLFIYILSPTIIHTTQRQLTWINAAAPAQVLWILIATLTLGLLIIIPNLILLLRTFKQTKPH